jgi:predicted PurR-regulated permease PerM
MPDPRSSPPPGEPPDAPLAAELPAVVRRRPVRAQHYLWVAGAVLAVAAALQWLGPVLTPFLVGAILAYLGDPIVKRCERVGISRGIGTLLTVVLFMLAGLAVVLVVVPLVQAEIGLIARRLPGLADLYASAVAPWLAEHVGIRTQLDLATLKQLITDNIDSARDLSVQLLAGVRSGGLLLLALVVNLALIPVVMFYLLRDWHGIVDRIDELVPRAWLPTVRGMATDIDHVLAEFLRGQVLVMLSLAVYYTIALSIVGVQFAVPIGILTGILVFIPYVGYGLGFVLGVLAALLQWAGWPGFVAVLAVYGVGQLLENYVLIPYLVGDRIGLHPLAVIFALLAFGQLFGFAGVLLALPVSAVLLVGLRRLRTAYVDSPLYNDE